MSDTDEEKESNVALKFPLFHGKRGEDYSLWRMGLPAACRIKNVWTVIESELPEGKLGSDAPDSSKKESKSSKMDSKRLHKLQKASGLIISALRDAPLHVVLDAEDDPARMMELLDSRYASSRRVSRIAVQTSYFG